MKKQAQQEQDAFSNETTLSSKTELEVQLRVDAQLEKSQSEPDLPWTEEELIAAGIEERHWPLAHWYSDLKDLKDSLAK